MYYKSGLGDIDENTLNTFVSMIRTEASIQCPLIVANLTDDTLKDIVKTFIATPDDFNTVKVGDVVNKVCQTYVNTNVNVQPNPTPKTVITNTSSSKKIYIIAGAVVGISAILFLLHKMKQK